MVGLLFIDISSVSYLTLAVFSINHWLGILPLMKAKLYYIDKSIDQVFDSADKCPWQIRNHFEVGESRDVIAIIARILIISDLLPML